MRKEYFYRCIKQGDKIVAIKTTGFVNDELGAHQEGENWIVTHIPTGYRIIAMPCKYAKTAINEANKQIQAQSDFKQKIQETMDSKEFKEFQRSRYDQSVTKNFIGMCD